MIRGRRRCDTVNGCGKYYMQEKDSCTYCGASSAFSDIIPFDPLHWVYDIESYPNIFTFSAKHPLTGCRARFEISDRKSDHMAFYEFVYSLSRCGSIMVGFNNIGYDYPVIHDTFRFSKPTASSIYQKSKSIIETPWNDRFINTVWDSECIVKQMDLLKIHHFDNSAKATSLKMLEFNMQSDSVEDLPFPPGTILDDGQKDQLLDYNDHDVDKTEEFYIHSIDAINFREEMGEKYPHDFTNDNDTKVGKQYFIMKLENEAKGTCYTYDSGSKKPRQTIRSSIALNDVILPYIKFDRPEFNEIVDYFRKQTIIETKGVFKELKATIDGFDFDYGVGGIHGSVKSKIVRTTDTHTLYDWDVKSYYPWIAMANNLYPEHLGPGFCKSYKGLYDERSQYDKGTSNNTAIKFGLNGVYGDSNNKYSPFYDPKYTMSITINGQLLLCMLAEQMMRLPGLSMIQINTDGLSVLCPDDMIPHMKSLCRWWEDFTCLTLEHAIYDSMFIRDVNNYLAKYKNGKLKNKGAYAHLTHLDLGQDWSPDVGVDWHQNHNSLIIPKAVEAYFIHNVPVEDTIKQHNNIHNFMLCTKIGKNDRLINSEGEDLQRTTRYYVTHTGTKLTKISPPSKDYKIGQWCRKNKLSDVYYNSVLSVIRDGPFGDGDYDSTGTPWDERINTKNKSKYKMRETKIIGDRKLTECNDIRLADFSEIDYDYYIQESYKLIKPLEEI